MDTITPNQNGGGGSKTTLYIVVFFLCVISVVVGYFKYQISSKESESAKQLAELRSKTESQIKEAKTSLEAEKIKQQAELDAAKIKAESAFADREAKIKAAEAKINSELKSAAETVKRANQLKATADRAQADAARKRKEADDAMNKAIASGNAVDKKLAEEKKKLAAEADRKVRAAQADANRAKQQATAEARKAINLKNQLDQVASRGTLMANALKFNAVPGYPPSGYHWGGEGPRNVRDPNVCREWARKKGFAMWGLRNNSHPTPAYKNTCFGYTSATSKRGTIYRGNMGDNIHMVGCTTGQLRPDQVSCPRSHYNREAATRSNDWGGGNSIYLDRHNVECGDDGLMGFRLIRPSGNRIRYVYGCKEGINSPRFDKNTGSNDWGGGNTIFLDRHNVDCGTNPIARFRLVRPAGNKIRYDYSCLKQQSTGGCRDTATPWNQESSQSIYLDRHNVACNADEVLTRFKLSRNGAGKFRYDYRCCKM